MDDRLRDAFAQVRAEEALKKRTLAYLAQSTDNWQTAPATRHRRRFRPLLTAAACAACLLMTLGSLWVYFTPAAFISVDVNPSLELAVNRFDRVISVTGLNDDGDALAQTLNVRFLDYTQALEQVLDSDTIAQCLARDEMLSITVAGDDAEQTEEMLSQVSACTAGQKNTYCHAADLETVTQAHDHGLSCGKYQMLLELQAWDPSLTAEDVRDMTMRELWDLLGQLSGGSSGQASDSSSGQAQGGNGQFSEHQHGHRHHAE